MWCNWILYLISSDKLTLVVRFPLIQLSHNGIRIFFYKLGRRITSNFNKQSKWKKALLTDYLSGRFAIDLRHQLKLSNVREPWSNVTMTSWRSLFLTILSMICNYSKMRLILDFFDREAESVRFMVEGKLLQKNLIDFMDFTCFLCKNNLWGSFLHS